MITLQGISKTYRVGFFYRPRRAVRDVSLTVEPGEVFGFIGANGAGKSTIIKLLLGLITPTRGTGVVDGYPLGDPRGRRRLGYLPEQPVFPYRLQVRRFLVQMARLKGLAAAGAEREVERRLEQTGLRHAALLQFGEYSKGMLQRAGLALSLLGNPQLLILDEPMSGLDLMGRQEVQDIIAAERKAGRTIFFSSHILTDVERIADRVGVMVRGNLSGLLTAAEFLASPVEDAIDVRLKMGPGITPELLSAYDPKWLERGGEAFLNIPGARRFEEFVRDLGPARPALLGVISSRRGLEAHFFEREVRR